jgi:predicted Zn-ribbon and HTH transcriptional regulator
MSALQKQRLANESEEERAQRLSHKSALQKQRLASESEEDRADRLAHMRNVRSNEVNHSPQIDLLQVKAKLLKFHQELSEINVPTCTICDETFPGMAVNKKSECIRCTRDKRTPKLFSADNDMHPGAVPAELQVCFSCLMHAPYPPYGKG